jgi:hypothetical protein
MAKKQAKRKHKAKSNEENKQSSEEKKAPILIAEKSCKNEKEYIISSNEE